MNYTICTPFEVIFNGLLFQDNSDMCTSTMGWDSPLGNPGSAIGDHLILLSLKLKKFMPRRVSVPFCKCTSPNFNKFIDKYYLFYVTLWTLDVDSHHCVQTLILLVVVKKFIFTSKFQDDPIIKVSFHF